MTTRSQARQTRSGTIIGAPPIPPPAALGKRKLDADTGRRSKRHASDAEVDAPRHAEFDIQAHDDGDACTRTDAAPSTGCLDDLTAEGAAASTGCLDDLAAEGGAASLAPSTGCLDDLIAEGGANHLASLSSANEERRVLTKFVGDLTDIITDKNKEINDLELKNVDLEKKLDTVNKALADARSNLQGSMSRRASLQARLDTANARVDSLQARLDAGNSSSNSSSNSSDQHQNDTQPPVWGRLVGRGGFPASSDLTKACTTIGRNCGATPCSHETPDIDVQNPKVSRMHLTVQKVADGLCIVHTGNNRPLVTNKDGTALSIRPLVPKVIPLTSTVFITTPKALPGTRMADMDSAPSFRFVGA